MRAPGFGNEYVDNLIVDESAVTTVPHPIKMAILQPYIGVGANLRVFTSKEVPSFWVNGTGLKEANIKLFKENILDFAKHSPGFSLGDDFRLIASHGKNFVKPFTKETPTAQFTRQLVSDSEDSSTSYFKCDHPLAPGDYVIEATGVATNGAPPPSEYGWFTVT